MQCKKKNCFPGPLNAETEGNVILRNIGNYLPKTQGQISEDANVWGHCCENLKSYTLRIFENKNPREIHVYCIDVKDKLSGFIGRALKHKHFSNE